MVRWLGKDRKSTNDKLIFSFSQNVKMISRLSVEFTHDIKLKYAKRVPWNHRQVRQPKIQNDLDKVNFQLRNTIVGLQFDFGGVSRFSSCLSEAQWINCY